MLSTARQSDSSIRVSNACFSYGQTSVFDCFCLEADSPLVVLKGPNGSGKTTLLKLIAGVFRPANDGHISRPMPVGLILQEDSLLPWLTVGGNIRVALAGREGNTHTNSLLAMIRPLMRRRACTLSFGQRRIVELYRILNGGFRLICLDEPFNFLDPSVVRLVVSAIQALSSEDTRFIIASHANYDLLECPQVIFEFDGSLPVHRLFRVSTP